MIKSTYKPGLDILLNNNMNGYTQYYWSDLSYKGYRKNGKHIGYGECYMVWANKGIKYIL